MQENQESPSTPPAPTPPESLPFVLIERSVAQELLEHLVAELRAQRRPWMTYTEDEQRDAIERLRKGVENGVSALTRIIVAAERPTMTADVDRVTFADSVRAVLKLPRSSPLVHELADHAGGQIVVVLVDPKAFAGGLDQVKPDAAQQELLGDGGEAAA